LAFVKSRWKRSDSAGSPQRSCTRAITPITASRWAPESRSWPTSKLPTVSNMNAPALWPAALAGVRFQSRPVQIVPSGAIERCWAMSFHPLTCVWWRHMPSIVCTPV
jgi:hypothetical protein